MDMGGEYSDVERGYEPLVDRLRNLHWPDVSAEARERCWREFQEMMIERGNGASNGSRSADREPRSDG